MIAPFFAKLCFVALAVGWYAIRVPHMLRARRTPTVNDARDWREKLLLSISFLGLGLIPLSYVFLGFGGVAERPFNQGVALAGILVAVLALYLFYETHRVLGRNWSVSLEIRQQHKLKTDGIYRYVRHPMYGAFWLWAVAQALLLPNWIAGLSGIVGFGTLYAFRVPVEEQMMRDAFGREYDEYVAVTSSVVPWKLLRGAGR